MRTFSLNLTCMIKADNTSPEKLWNTCEWKRNSDNVTCDYQSNSDGTISRKQCHNLLKKTDFERENNLECKMIIPSVEFADNGTWTCRMEKCQNVDNGGCENQNNCVGEATVDIKVLNIVELIKYNNNQMIIHVVLR